MKTFNENDPLYLRAKERVKKMKGFYVHATVYVLVNLFIIAGNVQSGNALSDINIYWTAMLWGAGLLAHAVSVFVPNFFLGRNWEERKTRELMDKYQ